MDFDWYKNLYFKYFKKNCFIFTDNFKKLKKINFLKTKKFKLIKHDYIRSFFIMKNCKYGIISVVHFHGGPLTFQIKKIKILNLLLQIIGLGIK